MNQLTLELGDRHQQLSYILENDGRDSGGSWKLYFDANSGNYWLGTRHHCLGGTDYDYIEKISYEEAVWLRDVKWVYPLYPEILTTDRSKK